MWRATAVMALALLVVQHACAGGMGQDDAVPDAPPLPRRGRTLGLLGNALFGDLLGGGGLFGGGGGGGVGGRPGILGGLPGILDGLFGGGGGGGGDGVRPLPIILLGSGGFLPPFRRPYRPSPAVPYYPRPYAYQGFLNDDDGYYYYRGAHQSEHLVPEFH